MVSSKCFHVESPSPFRFLAALMPPCAHTECDRLTGTMENKSTCPPISAILMTAERPARPPPTTMIFGFDAIDRISAFRELYFVAPDPASTWLAPTGSVACCACERNEVRLARPAPVSTKKKARHTTRNRLRAFSPETMPHFAQKSQ